MKKKLNPNIQEAISIFGTQQKMANKLNVSQTAVYKWLYCLRKPSPENAVKIQVMTNSKIKATDLLPSYRDDFFISKLKSVFSSEIG